MTVPHRSASIDALFHNGLTVWPGMTIFWIGDLAHQGEVSGHNPDDYPRVLAELTDADSDPEVRALDFMIGPHFTAADAANLVRALISGADKQRLYYVIYDHKIYKRSTGFKAEPYTGVDPHTNHLHASGHSSDDENARDWQSVLALGQGDDDMRVYVIQSSDPDWNERVYVSDGVHRRGPLRNPGRIQGPAVQGGMKIVLTDTLRSNDTWESYLTAVAGPPLATDPVTPSG